MVILLFKMEKIIMSVFSKVEGCQYGLCNKHEREHKFIYVCVPYQCSYLDICKHINEAFISGRHMKLQYE